MFLYHERQLGKLCGAHCVNNALQGPHFGPGDLAEIGARLDVKEKRLRGGRAAPDDNCDACADGGNFNIQVLQVAFARAGLDIIPAAHPEGKRLLKGGVACFKGAYVIQCRAHWLSLRFLGQCWWNLDSLLRLPKPLSDSELTRQIDKFMNDGNVFIVHGKELPTPLASTVEQGVDGIRHKGGNWHEASTLFVRASRSCQVSSSSALVDSRCGAPTLETFSDEEVRAALSMTGGSQCLAIAIMQKAHEQIERTLSAQCPSRLAKAICKAVDAVAKARRNLPHSIARLIALLCSPALALLQQASEIINCDELANRLLIMLAKKSRSLLWTEGLTKAATVAVELLMGLPKHEVSSPLPNTLDTSSSDTDAEAATVKDSIALAAALEFTIVPEIGEEGQSFGRPSVSALGLKQMQGVARPLRCRSKAGGRR